MITTLGTQGGGRLCNASWWGNALLLLLTLSIQETLQHQHEINAVKHKLSISGKHRYLPG